MAEAGCLSSKAAFMTARMTHIKCKRQHEKAVEDELDDIACGW